MPPPSVAEPEEGPDAEMIIKATGGRVSGYLSGIDRKKYTRIIFYKMVGGYWNFHTLIVNNRDTIRFKLGRAKSKTAKYKVEGYSPDSSSTDVLSIFEITGKHKV